MGNQHSEAQLMKQRAGAVMEGKPVPLLSPLLYGEHMGMFQRKVYSHGNIYEQAGIRCSVGLPTMCPFAMFHFSAPHHGRNRQESQGPQARPDWAVYSVEAPDDCIFGMKTSLFLENSFIPYVTLKRHQFVLEN